jgi:formylglycine-generating enzyme required for sulfatase activity
MTLEKYRSLLGATKGVVAYFAVDHKGKLLTQNKGALNEQFNQLEFASWLLNFFHAIDMYYPQCRCSMARYGNLQLYLRRGEGVLYAVLLNHEANLGAFTAAFDQQFAKGSAAHKNTPFHTAAEDSKTGGETVFMRLSQTGPASGAPTASVKPSTQPVGANKTASGKGVALVAAAVVLLLLLAFFLISGQGSAEADAGVEPVVAAASPSAGAAQQPSSPGSTLVTAEAEAQPEVSVEQWQAKLSAFKAWLEAEAGGLGQGSAPYASAVIAQMAAERAVQRGDASAATEALQQALDAYARSGYAALITQIEDDLEQGRLSAWVAEQNQLVRPVTEALAEAQAQFDSGRHKAAIEQLSELLSGLPQLRAEAISQLEALAVQSAQAGDVATALRLYKQLHQAEPTHQGALAFLYRNALEHGSTWTNDHSMDFIYLQPATYQRGASPQTDPMAERDESPHSVTLTKGFYLGKFEVTQAQWEAVMGELPGDIDRADAQLRGPNLPVHSLSWQQAQAFCERLSALEGLDYRLATEAEWEYAARAGTSGPFSTGGQSLAFDQANLYNPTTDPAPRPVGTSGPPNPWGFYDMHGNVREWCSDWWAPYPQSPVKDPEGPLDSAIVDINIANKIVRGGSFNDDYPLARSSSRLEANPVAASEQTGFRVVRTVSTFP